MYIYSKLKVHKGDVFYYSTLKKTKMIWCVSKNKPLKNWDYSDYILSNIRKDIIETVI